MFWAETCPFPGTGILHLPGHSLVSRPEPFHLRFCAGCKDRHAWTSTALAHVEGSSWVYHGDKRKSLLTDAIYFILSIKIELNVKLRSSAALSPSVTGIVSAMPTRPSPACKDTHFATRSSLPRPCSVRTRLNYIGNIEKSSLFDKVILPKHENHTPMIDGAATRSNS